MAAPTRLLTQLKSRQFRLLCVCRSSSTMAADKTVANNLSDVLGRMQQASQRSGAAQKVHENRTGDRRSFPAKATREKLHQI